MDGGMVKTSVRILVVEDFEPWRDFFRAELGRDLEMEIVGELSDGTQIVQEVERLRPDLILMDIGLASINGIEAAKLVHECCPNTKILFVSENRSADIAHKAMESGGNGYLVKIDVRKELLSGIRAVLAGRRFISTSMAGHFLVETTLSAQAMQLSWIMALIS
jgi:DNA-binding NarL/FixJ family response regulator